MWLVVHLFPEFIVGAFGITHDGLVDFTVFALKVQLLMLCLLYTSLSSRHPASLEVATLLRKKTPAQAKIDCKYLGFECPCLLYTSRCV